MDNLICSAAMWCWSIIFNRLSPTHSPTTCLLDTFFSSLYRIISNIVSSTENTGESFINNKRKNYTWLKDSQESKT